MYKNNWVSACKSLTLQLGLQGKMVIHIEPDVLVSVEFQVVLNDCRHTDSSSGI